MKYAVRIEETLARTVIVDAPDYNSAINKVSDLYTYEGIILGADDYCDTEFVESGTFGKDPIDADDERLIYYEQLK